MGFILDAIGATLDAINDAAEKRHQLIMESANLFIRVSGNSLTMDAIERKMRSQLGVFNGRTEQMEFLDDVIELTKNPSSPVIVYLHAVAKKLRNGGF